MPDRVLQDRAASDQRTAPAALDPSCIVQAWRLRASKQRDNAVACAGQIFSVPQMNNSCYNRLGRTTDGR